MAKVAKRKALARAKHVVNLVFFWLKDGGRASFGTASKSNMSNISLCRKRSEVSYGLIRIAFMFLGCVLAFLR